MTYIKRLIEFPSDYSFLLFGPRQVGKSTLIAQRFSEEETMVFDLLDYSLLRSLNKNPDLFLEQVNSRAKEIKYVLVDEVQKLPWLLDQVHLILEKKKNPPYFILTGSSARKLKKSGANMLAGRALTRSLFSLLYEEIKNSSIDFSLDRVLRFGSLPAVYTASSDERRKEILRSYTETYVKEEIKEEALVRNLDAFHEFLLLAAAENGNTINYSNIAGDIGLSSQSVKEYYQILEDTLIGFKLLPFKKNLRQQITKSPKFYFFDTGVQRSLADSLDLPLHLGTDDYGRSFEHWLIKEIIHKASTLNKAYRFYFYRVKESLEVDLIIEKQNQELLAIEIKASDNPKSSHLRGLKSFNKICPEAKLFCASLVKNKVEKDGVLFIPWQNLLEEI